MIIKKDLFKLIYIHIYSSNSTIPPRPPALEFQKKKRQQLRILGVLVQLIRHDVSLDACKGLERTVQTSRNPVQLRHQPQRVRKFKGSVYMMIGIKC